MAEPFLGEIRITSFVYAPPGWALCNGQLLPINQNQALFSLLGTQYGGNGQTNFALPDLRGRTPIMKGNGFIQGQNGGAQAHTLSISEIPAHNHFVNAVAPPVAGTNVNTPAGNFLSNSAPAEIYNSGAGNPQMVALIPATISNTGGSQTHLNMQPYITMSFMIALIGIFPSG